MVIYFSSCFVYPFIMVTEGGGGYCDLKVTARSSKKKTKNQNT